MNPRWTRKPVLVLLNQLGAPRPLDQERADVERWTRYVAGYPWVRGTLAFDAFARCWIQEHALLERIRASGGSAGPSTGRRRWLRATKGFRDSVDALAAESRPPMANRSGRARRGGGSRWPASGGRHALRASAWPCGARRPADARTARHRPADRAARARGQRRGESARASRRFRHRRRRGHRQGQRDQRRRLRALGGLAADLAASG
jgi:hypothetical protein